MTQTTEHVTHATIKKIRRYAWEITLHKIEQWENPETCQQQVIETSDTYTLTDKDYARMLHIAAAMERTSVYGDAIEVMLNKPKARNP